MQLIIITKSDNTKLNVTVSDHDVENYIKENRHTFGQDDEFEMRPALVKEAWNETIPSEIEGEEPTTISHEAVYEDQPFLIKERDWTYEVRDITEALHIIDSQEAYLRSTDWYCSRLVETGEEIPQSVRTLRAQARIDLEEARIFAEIKKV